MLQEAVKTNAFSKHDNRHTIENAGVYLGMGLGRKQFQDPKTNQHRTSTSLSEFLTPKSEHQRRHTSTHSSGHRQREGQAKRSNSASVIAATRDPFITQDSKPIRRCTSALIDTTRKRPPTPVKATIKPGPTPIKAKLPHLCVTKTNLRRFPHKYTLPKDMEAVRPSVHSKWWWYKDVRSNNASGVSNQHGEQAKKTNVPNNIDAASNNRDAVPNIDALPNNRDAVPNIDAAPAVSNRDAVPKSSTFIGTQGKLQSQSFATSTTPHHPPLLRNSSWKY